LAISLVSHIWYADLPCVGKMNSGNVMCCQILKKDVNCFVCLDCVLSLPPCVAFPQTCNRQMSPTMTCLVRENTADIGRQALGDKYRQADKGYLHPLHLASPVIRMHLISTVYDTLFHTYSKY